MTITPQISLVIPAYNEEDRIEAVLSKYSNRFQNEEIIVVCDGSDNTPSIVEKLSENYPTIRSFSFEKRLGKGGGIIEGFKVADEDKIGFVDTDINFGGV